VQAGPTIREVEESDAEAVHAIYAYHVLRGTASFDYEPPPVDAIAKKIHWILSEGWPFVVAELDGTIAGYAYVTQFRDRAAYRFTAEDSIYVQPDRIGCGMGKALLDALVERSAAFGFRTIIAVIGGAEPRSVALHAGAHFREVGRLGRVGWKHDRWLDSVYMQRELVQTG
jgi:L-amino acid N-acyltransferase YncA